MEEKNQLRRNLDTSGTSLTYEIKKKLRINEAETDTNRLHAARNSLRNSICIVKLLCI